VDGIKHLLVLLRSGDRQNLGMRAGDVIGLCAQTPGDDHPPFWVNASPMASRLSALALSRNPQVFTITASAPA
jgi:hypothetical protein